MHARLNPYVGKRITIGIRPEDMLENESQTLKPGISIQAPVEVVEPMGSEINLYLTIGNQAITARIKSDREPEVNKPHILDINTANIHFFDIDTEKTVV